MEDREIINFLKKGPKYCPHSKINWTECCNVIHDALSSYCKKWCKRECKNIVNIRISHLENNFDINKSPKSYSRIKTKLQKLATRFVFVPADKAANNVV